MNHFTTREEWLQALVSWSRAELFAPAYSVPANIRIACGFTGDGARQSGNVGDCWPPGKSADGHFEIFIKPTLADPLGVAGTTIHELVHTIANDGHGKEFKRIATYVGLTGPMRSTTSSDDLIKRLGPVLESLGPYPHAALDAQSDRKRQTTRMVKCECAERLVRTTRTCLEAKRRFRCTDPDCGGLIESTDLDTASEEEP